MNRREFLFGSLAATGLVGCRSLAFTKSDLRFGVVSDVHVTTRKSCKLFKKSLRYMKRRGVDAVMVPGDLTDWGIKPSFVFFKESWDEVFGGTEVVPLFCTGNHDFDGHGYGDMQVELRANGYTGRENVKYNEGMEKAWQEVFGEPYASIRCRTVKGFDFVSGEWYGYDELAKWMEANGKRFEGTKPFFYFQHPPIRGTTSDSFGWADSGKSKPVLAKFPNCIAFTGHAHHPFIDERSIWQGEFTAVAVPSLSYAGSPGKQYENGHDDRSPKTQKTMPVLPSRANLRGGQGYIVDVWADQVVLERVDFEEEAVDMDDWVVPLPACRGAKPYDQAARAKTYPVPVFPAGAELDIETRNTEARNANWAISLNVEFPSAVMPKGTRVYDYELTVVPKDGSAPLVKRFVSPAWTKMAKYEPARQRFWFNVNELPGDVPYVVEMRARNCFGVASKPLVSDVRPAKHVLKRRA